MLKMIAGGWQLGTVAVAQSGNPFTVVCGGSAFKAILDASGRIVGNCGCDYNADGAGPDRPNAPSFGSTIGTRTTTSSTASSKPPTSRRRRPARRGRWGATPSPGRATSTSIW